MTIDQWKGYSFTEQLSAAAYEFAKIPEDQRESGAITNHYVELYDDFIAGAKWALQSELVREMETALNLAYPCLDREVKRAVEDNFGSAGSEWAMAAINDRDAIYFVLQKLKLARGEK